MSQKQVKRYRKVIDKAFSANELQFQKRFLLQAIGYGLRDRVKLCWIITFKRKGWIAK